MFVELKSRSGLASKVQKQVRAELLAAGALWWMARSANAAMMALHLSGVPFVKQCRSEPAAASSPGRGGAAAGGAAGLARTAQTRS